jgi:polar amino acid transport system permease protein
MWDWQYAASIMPMMVRGLWITIQVAVLASVVALTVGLVIAAGQRLLPRHVSRVLTRGAELIRATPLLVQLFFVYYGLPRFGFTLPAMVTGVAVCGLHYATYASEAYRAGIAAIPVGLWEAGHALGLPTARMWRRVVVPLAARACVPALGNYVIMLYKQTAILFAITVPVLLGAARTAGYQSFRYLEPYTIAGVLYLAISAISAVAVRRMEKADVFG